MEFEQLICVYKQVHGAGVAGGADILLHSLHGAQGLVFRL